MRFTLFGLLLAASSIASANTYTDCTVENVHMSDSAPTFAIVTLSCVAPDAATSAGNCSGTILNNAFAFDSNTPQGKAHLALVLTALTTGSTVSAATYAACSQSVPNVLWLYSIKVNR